MVIAEKLRVMTVDDSQTIQNLFRSILKKANCEVYAAKDGYEALSKITAIKPDVILVDIDMPRLNGYQTCALIKNNDQLKHTPIILISSKGGLVDKAKGRLVGCDDYLTKPFS